MSRIVNAGQDSDSTRLLLSEQNGKSRRYRKSNRFLAIGISNLFSLSVAAILTIFGGSCVAYSVVLLFQLLDEMNVYHTLFKSNDNITACAWRTVSSIEFNQSQFAEDLLNKAHKAEYQLLTVLIIYIATMIVAQSLWTNTIYRLMNRIRVGFFNELLHKEMAWYDIHPSTELTPLITESMMTIEEGFETQLCLFFEYFGTSMSAIVLAYITLWKVALILNIVLMLAVLLTVILLKVSFRHGYAAESFSTKAMSIAGELLWSIRTVVAFGGEQYGVDRYQNCMKHSKYSSLKFSVIFGIAVSLFFLSGYGIIPLGYGIGIYFIQQCVSTIQEVTIVCSLMIIATIALLRELHIASTIGVSIGTFLNILSIWTQDCEKKDKSFNTFQTIVTNGRIQFSNICFCYPSRPNVRVLQGIDFIVEPGQSIALIGPSGCGKTTVIKLLLGLYECDGLITVDSADITYIDQQCLRQQIGLVSQEPVLFNVSIYDNIQYSNPSAKRYQVENAAKMANIHDFIMELPNDYETIVGEGGIQLSGGQKQRVAIARALVRNPKILLFDEATSALDGENEKIVQEALNKAMKGRTSITIAHRLSTIKKSDVIIGIDKGYVVEKGSHDELMEKQGLYYNLMMKQERLEKDGLEENEEKSYTATKLVNHDHHHDESENESQCSLRYVDVLLLIKENKLSCFLILVSCILMGLKGMMLTLLSSITGFLAEETNVLQENNFVFIYLLIAILAGLFATIAAFWIQVLGRSGGGKLIKNLRFRMLRSMMKQDISWFDKPQNAVGLLLTRLNVDPAMIEQITGDPILDATEILFLLVSTAIVLLLFSWFLAVIILPLIALIFISQLVYFAVSWRIVHQLKPQMESFSKVAVESINNIEAVKSLGITDSMEKMYRQRLKKIERLKLPRMVLQAFLLSSGIPLMLFSFIIVFVVVMNDFVLDKSAFGSSISLFVSYILLILSVCFPYKNIITKLPSFQNAWLSVARIMQLLCSEPLTNKKGGIIPEKITTSLCFDGVEFSYSSRPNVPALRNINITIEEGKTLAIVGPSGSGKSTIVSLIERFYEPVSGEILIGTININHIDVSWFRQQISLVSQEPVLFNMSIKDNIRYGALSRNVTDEEVIEAAKVAKIHDFVISLPKGYETIVGLKGVQLSGGQKQRVAIARAMIQDPKILLLDEATSSLDTENEEIVQKALNKARQGRTTIIIAHRMSTIQNADKIVVLDKGTILEQGTHSELMKKRGAYYSMNT